MREFTLNTFAPIRDECILIFFAPCATYRSVRHRPIAGSTGRCHHPSVEFIPNIFASIRGYY